MNKQTNKPNHPTIYLNAQNIHFPMEILSFEEREREEKSPACDL